jgi:hypothetical protein
MELQPVLQLQTGVGPRGVAVQNGFPLANTNQIDALEEVDVPHGTKVAITFE